MAAPGRVLQRGLPWEERIMRKRFGVLAAVGALFVGGAAFAAPVPTGATLSLTFVGVGTFSFTGAGSVSVSGSTVKVPAGLVAQTAPIPLAVTATTGIYSITAMNVANAAGTFSLGGVTQQASGEVCPGGPLAGTACVGGGGIGGVLPLTGTLQIRIGSIALVPVPLTQLRHGDDDVGRCRFERAARARDADLHQRLPRNGLRTAVAGVRDADPAGNLRSRTGRHAAARLWRRGPGSPGAAAAPRLAGYGGTWLSQPPSWTSFGVRGWARPSATRSRAEWYELCSGTWSMSAWALA